MKILGQGIQGNQGIQGTYKTHSTSENLIVLQCLVTIVRPHSYTYVHHRQRRCSLLHFI